MILPSIPFILADSDTGIGTIIIFVIVIVVTIAQKLFEVFKPKPGEEGPAREGGYDSTHEQQIKDIIESLKREQDIRDDDEIVIEPDEYDSVDFQPLPMEVDATPTPPIPPLDPMPQPSREPSLSPAELEALERLKSGTGSTVASAESKVPSLTDSTFSLSSLGAGSLRQGLDHPDILRAAILYHEVLGKPVALRETP